MAITLKAESTQGVDETVDARDGILEATWMYSRRVSATSSVCSQPGDNLKSSSEQLSSVHPETPSMAFLDTKPENAVSPFVHFSTA